MSEENRDHEVACALVTCRNRVLLIQRRADDSWPLGWHVPGGKIERGESQLRACQRELEEETGLIVATSRMTFLESNAFEDFPSQTYHAYHVEVFDYFPKISCEDGCNCGWFTADMVPHVALFPAPRLVVRAQLCGLLGK